MAAAQKSRSSAHLQKVSWWLLILSLLLATAMTRLDAAQLTGASITLGNPNTNVQSSYTATASSFTTATTIRCIDLELNTSSDGTGSVPAGVTTTSSTLNSSSLITTGNWSVDNGTNGTLRITNASGETPASSGNVVWGNVTNGSSESTTYYGLLSTFSDVGCSSPVDTVTMAYVYKDGEPVSLDIGATLTFACNAVGTTQPVNSASTNTASTSTGIDFGSLTTASNGISAHDLEVSTNAAGGYSVYIRHTSDLQTASASTISVHGGNNASPTAFSAPGTEAWGYTTEDSSLSGGSPDRFTSAGGDKWAGFNTVNEEVVYNNVAAPSTETTRVGHQVGIAADTPAGSYQTTIVYTIVATY